MGHAQVSGVIIDLSNYLKAKVKKVNYKVVNRPFKN